VVVVVVAVVLVALDVAVCAVTRGADVLDADDAVALARLLVSA
jgi:hypothetical protein